jgi:hypothetical protein
MQEAQPQSGDEEEIAAVAQLLTRPPNEFTLEWLRAGGQPHAFGLPFLSLFGDEMDCWTATLSLQACRPELPKDLLAIRSYKSHLLCVRSPTKARDEAMLVQVDLESDRTPIETGCSFEAYIRSGLEDLRRTERIIDRIDWLLAKQRSKYDHVEGGKLPRANEWRVVRSCVHDRVVGLAGVRQDDQRDATIIDLFEASDHPLYEPGHGIRSITTLVLADAYKTGASLSLIFRRVSGLREAVVPPGLVRLCQELGIELHNAGGGLVSHGEGVALFAALSGLSAGALDYARVLPSSARLSIEALSYLVTTRAWTPEEAEWILTTAPRPSAVLFGEDHVDDWLLLAESAAFGRAALLASLFRSSLNENGEEGVEASLVSVEDACWSIELASEADSVWADIRFSRGARIRLAAWPRRPLAFEPSLVLQDARRLAANAGDEDVRILLYSEETAGVDLTDIAPALAQLAVRVVFAPYGLAELDQLLEARLAKARRVRR